MQQYIKQPAQLTKAVPASGGDGGIRTHVPAHHRQNDFESFSQRVKSWSFRVSFRSFRLSQNPHKIRLFRP